MCVRIHQKDLPQGPSLEDEIVELMVLSVKVLCAVRLIPRACCSFKTQWSDASPLRAPLS